MGILEFMSTSPVLTFFLAGIIGLTIVCSFEAISNAIVYSVQSICKLKQKE